MEARLTLETGVAVSTTDQANKTTLYLTPYKGCQVAIYDGVSTWSVIELTADLSLDISGYTASKPYDIWVYNNAGTLTLDSTVWTNTTTRATALALQNGVQVKTGATTRRYLGTIYMDAASKCQDKSAERFVWNMYNRCPRSLSAKDPTNSWTYQTATFRAANNNTTDGVGRVAFILGLAEDVVEAKAIAIVQNSSAGVDFNAGIGLDSTTAQSGLAAQVRGAGAGYRVELISFYTDVPAIGYHYLQQLEMSAATGTSTWDGDGNDPTHEQAGLVGVIQC
jgi:hypothetical protein